ncbi:MAG: hypothetical protein EOO68_05135 [Moraxellaceae bacterium]|nr:MAG: hypothetical protein EOO68_05135 [Moraxellaceae bacterium]
MFTGIVQAVATIENVTDLDGIRTFIIGFPAGFCQDLQIGASVAIDGTCLTVTEIIDSLSIVVNSQVGIPILGVVENMCGLRQAASGFTFRKAGEGGKYEDITQQVLSLLTQHLGDQVQSAK